MDRPYVFFTVNKHAPEHIKIEIMITYFPSTTNENYFI